MHDDRMTLESPLARRDVILGRLAQGQSVVAGVLFARVRGVRRRHPPRSARPRGGGSMSPGLRRRAAAVEGDGTHGAPIADLATAKQASLATAASLVNRDSSYSSTTAAPIWRLSHLPEDFELTDRNEFDRHRSRRPAAVRFASHRGRGRCRRWWRLRLRHASDAGASRR